MEKRIDVREELFTVTGFPKKVVVSFNGYDALVSTITSTVTVFVDTASVDNMILDLQNLRKGMESKV